MPSDGDSGSRPTRRDYVKYGGTVVGTVLAGCSSAGDDGTTEPQATDTTDPGTTAGSESTTADGAYSVEMAPMGSVEFDEVPEDVFTILGHHADMLLALGRGDAINAMHAPGYHEAIYEKFLPHLDGVTVDWEGLYSSWPPTKEKLYELDSDVHIADPAKVATADGWDEGDVEEIRENVGPWFGNTLSGTNREPPKVYADDYEFYTLWEIFARVARVFRATDRYETLASVHESMLETIQERLPPAEDRPSAALVLFSGSEEKLWGYKLNHPGYYAAHTRPMGVDDALADAVGEGYGDDGRNVTMDYETLLEADPDVLLVFGPMTSYYDIDEIRSTLRNDEVASALTAVQNERVYVQGARRQGPILNLFQTEMTAKQLYPEAFGAWPGYENGQPYPDIPADERLFDRDRVADAITGDQ
jgi:ABC-type Fe3+-hydroxamate transport system substrate-binding protein